MPPESDIRPYEKPEWLAVGNSPQFQKGEILDTRAKREYKQSRKKKRIPTTLLEQFS